MSKSLDDILVDISTIFKEHGLFGFVCVAKDNVKEQYIESTSERHFDTHPNCIFSGNPEDTVTVEDLLKTGHLLKAHIISLEEELSESKVMYNGVLKELFT